MKKLLAIVLVLGLASFAGAALKLNVTGSTLNIVAAGGEASQYFVLEGAVSGGTLTGGLDSTFSFFGSGALGTGMAGIEGYLATPVGVPSMSKGMVISGISYQGVGPFNLYQAWETGETQLLDTVTIPEPITMTLMGLGGLVALRRRMA